MPTSNSNDTNTCHIGGEWYLLDRIILSLLTILTNGAGFPEICTASNAHYVKLTPDRAHFRRHHCDSFWRGDLQRFHSGFSPKKCELVTLWVSVFVGFLWLFEVSGVSIGRGLQVELRSTKGRASLCFATSPTGPVAEIVTASTLTGSVSGPSFFCRQSLVANS
jgi:hypothetical protein